jgi:phosphorylcholine metabolism protein LicD
MKLKFENIEVLGIVGYHQYLTMIYGDYMTPPVASERTPRHNS